MNRNYQVIIDMERALKFYTKFFQSSPIFRRKDFSLFKVQGKIFGLIERELFKQSCIDHDEILLKMMVKDIKSEFERIKFIGVEMDEQIIESADFSFFHFHDSEGNIIRVFGFR